MLPAVLPPEPPPLAGLSPSFTLPALVIEGGVVACVAVVDVDKASVEFLRDAGPDVVPDAPLAVFLDRVLVPPIGRLAPDPRLRFLMTSVFKLSGRTTPCSFRNRPQALHRGCPSGLRRQRGVVCVKQFVHVVGVFPSPWLPPDDCRFVVDPCLEPSGEAGRLGATDE